MEEELHLLDRSSMVTVSGQKYIQGRGKNAFVTLNNFLKEITISPFWPFELSPSRHFTSLACIR